MSNWSLGDSDAFLGATIYHVIPCLGDSLAVGNGQSINYSLDVGRDGRAFQWPLSGAPDGIITPLNEPLFNAAPQTTKIGALTSFMNEYLAPQPPNVRGLIVPCGIGSTGFAKTGFDVWNSGGSAYNTAVSETLAALAACPAGSFIPGFIWRIGSNDCTYATTEAWLAKLCAATTAMRTSLSTPNAWAVLVQMCPEGIALSHTNNDPIDFAGKNFPYTMANTGFVWGATGSSIDLPHYDAPPERLNGPKIANVVFNCLTNTTNKPATVSGTPSITAFTSSTVSLSWTAATYSAVPDGTSPDASGYAIAFDYKVEYKIHTDSTWTEFSHAASTATTIQVTGLTASTAYDFRITSKSYDGTLANAPSATVQQTTAAPVSFSVVDDFTMGSTNSGTSVTYVMRIKAANIQHTPSNSVTKFRLKAKGSINRCYIGMATGSAMDAASLVQVLWGGNAVISQSTSTETMSDDVTLSWDKSTDIIISLETSAAAGSYCYSNSNENGNLVDLWSQFGVLQADVANKVDGDYGTLAAGRMTGISQLQCNGF